jgi:CHAD domain-containing protein
MPAETEREIETKFDVAPDFAIRDVRRLLTEGDTVERSDDHLVSVYHDTAELDLVRAGLALRRRSGSSDTGWHLKTPGDGFRTEWRWPLEGNDTLPVELGRLITVFSHGNPVWPVVELRIHRMRYKILTTEGDLRYEIADDQVWATSFADGAPVTVRTPRWHEVEVELGPAGTAADLSDAADFLTTHGAVHSQASSKLVRALWGTTTRPAVEGTAAATIYDYLVTQIDAITAGHFAVSQQPFDPDAVTATHEAVHKTRVATRRFRAVMRVYAHLFESSRIAWLEPELRWYASELAEVRDREVLRVRLARAIDELPAYLVVGPVAEHIDEVLLAELKYHADEVLQVLRSPRYHDLMDELSQWRSDPPFAAPAAQPAESLIKYVKAAKRNLAKRIADAGARQGVDEDLHRARKAGKRLRYAAEAAEPALGKRATKIANDASNLQTVLGEHQDAVVATVLLRRIADQVAETGENGFTYGILVGEQRRLATESARQARALADGE